MVNPQSHPAIREICPWTIARHFVGTSHHLSQDTRKRVLGLIRSRALAALCSVGDLLDQEYQDPDINEALALRQVSALFKKNEAFSDEKLCKENAQKSFERAEKICRITNRRLDHYGLNPGRLDSGLALYVRRMQHGIAALLGEVDEFVGELPQRIRVTNGATQDRTRKRALPFLKITGKLRAPKTCVPFLTDLLLKYGVDLSSCKWIPTFHNVVDFVPKNWKTHRIIAKEPTHSLPFQLAIDSFLKEKLKGRWGVDLHSQLVNQSKAKEGSLDGSLATIDLSMASDTLALNCVVLLLPWAWTRFLMAFRSSHYESPFGKGTYAKFSSMGNGYTFSLETLIFTAACRAVGSQQYAVYGDDIVIESELVPELLRLLAFLGFLVNKEKSFVNPLSRFRESCGGDYYNGRLVTPFYLREIPKLSQKASVCHMINGLVGVTNDGPLWSYLSVLVRQEKLRIVPWNEDSRSGVWITPHAAWKLGKIYTDRRPDRFVPLTPKERVRAMDVGPLPKHPRKRVVNGTQGFLVFDGYVGQQETRKCYGWRSLLLWHIKANSVVVNVGQSHSHRYSTMLLKLTADEWRDSTDSRETTSVSVRTKYKHAVRRYQPPRDSLDFRTLPPMHLFLWEEVILGNASCNQDAG